MLLVILSIIFPAPARLDYQDSCHSNQILEESCAEHSPDREYLRSWIEDILSPHFVPAPGLSQSGECDSLLEVRSCSWGDCHHHYSGPATITLTDGSLVTGSVTAATMSGPVNITGRDNSLLQVIFTSS